MENNEIIIEEEVMELAEDISTGTGNVLKITTGVGLTVLGGFAAYKYIVKPVASKIKDKIKQKKIDKEFENIEIEEDECYDEI